jgi:hypothetical protein
MVRGVLRYGAGVAAVLVAVVSVSGCADPAVTPMTRTAHSIHHRQQTPVSEPQAAVPPPATASPRPGETKWPGAAEAYQIQQNYFGRDTFAYDPLSNEVGTGSAGDTTGAGGSTAGNTGATQPGRSQASSATGSNVTSTGATGGSGSTQGRSRSGGGGSAGGSSAGGSAGGSSAGGSSGGTGGNG